MENEILKEQLEKFKLYSKYNTSRTLQENVEDIFEQYKTPEEEIYYTLVRAAADTFGTNEKLLKQAFSKIKNPGQYKAVENMMSKRPIKGYKEIGTLLNKELESDNAVDFIEIQKMLAPLGINMTAKVGASGRQMDPNTIKVAFGAGNDLGNEVITARKEDEPTGNLAKVKDLPGVVVTAGKKKNGGSGLTFKPNENFPIKFMDMGEKVKQLQTALNVLNKAGQPNITGKFYTTTEQKLVNKMSELGLTYDRNKGVDEETFNLILNGPKPSRELEKPITIDRKDVNLNVPKELPKTLPTQAPTFQTPTTELPLEQQFQLAKIELQKAKDALDAAQETRDRAQIGAARGIQQAARKKVQDLRAQLYPPQQ
jgi:peptidoglycan hydrolase-like protein with peptidoglycan-binding domain